MMALTENGAVSLSTTQDARLDLFFKTVRDLGSFDEAIPEKYRRVQIASTGVNDRLRDLIIKSWEVDKMDTMKILINWRDCRGGKGDYTGFIVAMSIIYEIDSEWVKSNLENIVHYGCWLDLIKLWHICPTGKKDIIELIAQEVQSEKPSLLAKWIPSENAKWDRVTKDRFCLALCRELFDIKKVELKHLRKLRKDFIARLREKLALVETKLCEKDYESIDYEKVPSCAMKKYRRTFERNDQERFIEYIQKVKIGEAKINASQVYPHDLVRAYFDSTSKDDVVEAQWKEIKKKVDETGAFANSISVVDVSGSMEGTPMEVAIALGLLGLNESNGNRVITFHEVPKLHHVPDGTLMAQVENIKDMDWGESTNFERVMDLVLGVCAGAAAGAIQKIFIFSDMQFDRAMGHYATTHFEIVKKKFKEAKVSMPHIIFWNLRGDTRDFPVITNENGVVMLSGYSQSLLSSLIDNEEITPIKIMFKIIRAPRYDRLCRGGA